MDDDMRDLIPWLGQQTSPSQQRRRERRPRKPVPDPNMLGMLGLLNLFQLFAASNRGDSPMNDQQSPVQIDIHGQPQAARTGWDWMQKYYQGATLLRLAPWAVIVLALLYCNRATLFGIHSGAGSATQLTEQLTNVHGRADSIRGRIVALGRAAPQQLSTFYVDEGRFEAYRRELAAGASPQRRAEIEREISSFEDRLVQVEMLLLTAELRASRLR